jgi:hypothetical protein
MNLIGSLYKNIFINLNLVRQDYIGASINTDVFINVLMNLSISLMLIFISYLLGNRIRLLFFKKTNKYSFNYLISVALGYIFISIGITILGFLNILKNEEIILYLFLISIFAILPKKSSLKSIDDLVKSLNLILKEIKKEKFIYVFTILFILLASINLINPEIREDQYHVDFPKIYLSNQTIMVPPRESFHVSGSTMLSEMYYTIGIFLYSVETARYIHFLFYILVILTLFELVKKTQEKYFEFVPIIFITAPVVIHETSSIYVDFEWMFCFLLALAILFLEDKLSNKKSVLIGILLGGMLSTKLWTIVFIPAVILYLIIFVVKVSFKKRIIHASLISVSAFFITFIWFLRSYILTGNPLYPAFSKTFTLEKTIDNFQLSHYLSLNYALLNPLQYLNTFSPLVFLGTLFILYKFKDNIVLLWKSNIFKFFLILLFIYIVINYPFGRYLLGLYVLFIFVSSVGLKRVLERFTSFKYLINLGVLVLFLYYLINSIFVLPYTFGISDKNKYLSRILIRDNSSYFDFGGMFNKNISKNDYVATYGIFGYYYAPFKFVDINFILDVNHRDIYLLKKNRVTKLFIRGGDVNWLCARLSLTNCNPSKYSLISKYQVYPTYYLYKLK